MLMKLNNKYRQRGIGLLELMLSLAIIALLLIMATRYYTTATQSQQVSSAVSMIQGIRAGAHVYYSQGGTPATLTMKALMDAGLVPKEFGAVGGSPWQSTMTLAAAADKPPILTIPNVPAAACTMLGNMLKNQMTVSPVPTACGTTGVQAMTFDFTAPTPTPP
jgi:type II secretory pathway pseudopilin PulG